MQKLKRENAKNEFNTLRGVMKVNKGKSLKERADKVNIKVKEMSFEKEYNNFWSKTDLEKKDARSRQRGSAVLNLIKDISPQSCLILGCGRGIIGEMIKERGFPVQGIDISEEAVEMAKTRGIKAIKENILHYKEEEKFPLIISLEVLEHTPNPSLILTKIKKLLLDKGIFIISLPNEFHLIVQLKKLFGFPLIFNHHHLHLFTPKKSREVLQKNGFEIGRAHV